LRAKAGSGVGRLCGAYGGFGGRIASVEGESVYCDWQFAGGICCRIIVPAWLGVSEYK